MITPNDGDYCIDAVGMSFHIGNVCSIRRHRTHTTMCVRGSHMCTDFIRLELDEKSRQNTYVVPYAIVSNEWSVLCLRVCVRFLKIELFSLRWRRTYRISLQNNIRNYSNKMDSNGILRSAGIWFYQLIALQRVRSADTRHGQCGKKFTDWGKYNEKYFVHNVPSALCAAVCCSPRIRSSKRTHSLRVWCVWTSVSSVGIGSESERQRLGRRQSMASQLLQFGSLSAVKIVLEIENFVERSMAWNKFETIGTDTHNRNRTAWRSDRRMRNRKSIQLLTVGGCVLLSTSFLMFTRHGALVESSAIRCNHKKRAKKTSANCFFGKQRK